MPFGTANCCFNREDPFKPSTALDFIPAMHVGPVWAFSQLGTSGDHVYPPALCGGGTALHHLSDLLGPAQTTIFHPMTASNPTAGQAWQGLPWCKWQFQGEESGEEVSKTQKQLFLPSHQRIRRTNNLEEL